MSDNTLNGHAHSVVQARDIHGNVHIHQRGPGGGVGRVVPAQLLSPPGVWVDRDEELTALTGNLTRRAEGAAALVVITGAGGVGKTSLALRWLHQIRGEYADGQLFTDLRGFSGVQPARPGEVLERFLRALGVAPDRVPLDPHEQAALFRTLTTGRRLIVLLDNAYSAEQVQPLLPGAGPWLVVATTRRRMTGLTVHGPHFFHLGPLEKESAAQLLAALVGAERTSAEPQATRDLAARCGGLPLAVCLSGAYLSGHQRHSIEHFTARLTDETARLLQLRMEDQEMNDTSLQAAFTASYQELPPEAQRLYRLLSVYPGEGFDTHVAQAAADVTSDEADRLLDILTDRHLIDEPPTEMCRFHDLARAHAHGLAEQIDGQQRCQEAFARIADHLLRRAVAAALELNPNRWYLGRYFQPQHQTEPMISYADRINALEWLEDHHRHLVAVAEQAHTWGMHDITCEIVEAMWPLFLHHKLYSVWINAHQLGLNAATACGDVRMQARMLNGIAAAYNHLHEFDRAESHARQCLQLELQTGHQIGEASALEILGVAAMATGRSQEAIELFERSRTLHWRNDRPRGAALQTRHLGEAHAKAGQYDKAAEYFSAALQFFTADQEPYLRARALSGLADTHLHTGRLVDADRTLRESLKICRKISAHHEEANVLVMMAHLAHHHGNTTTWRTNLKHALNIYTQLDAPQVTEITQQLTTHPTENTQDSTT